MRYMMWIVAGFALLMFSNFLGALGDLGETPGERLPFNITALLVLLGALFCFIKGIRACWRVITGGTVQRVEPSQPVVKTKPLPVEADGPERNFDPEQAFANYMRRREEASAPEKTAPRQSAPQAGGFGRKRA